jgi:hypothetical protein
LVRVSRRVGGLLARQRPAAGQFFRLRSGWRWIASPQGCRPGRWAAARPPAPPPFCAPPRPHWLTTCRRRHAGLLRTPSGFLQRFQALFTLRPECFSTFPRGTCSLSVSRRCLALGRVYVPLWAALPSNPTLRGQLAGRRGRGRHGALTLHGGAFQRTYTSPRLQELTP